MSSVSSVGTYLPPWGSESKRAAGPDEDAVTLAVAAARAAAPAIAQIARVVFVTRDLPLLDGGNGAVLLAGIGLSDDTPVVEQIGGAADALAAVADAAPGTLVVAADAGGPDGSEPAGAAAVLIGEYGAELASVGRVTRSLPVRARAQDSVVRDYDDPRLMRERGTGVALERLGLSAKPDILAGLAPKQAKGLCAGAPVALPTVGASSALFAVASATEQSSPTLVVAVDQASVAAVTVSGSARVTRREPAVQPVPQRTSTPGPDIPISLAAYERAFEPKLKWEAGKCNQCSELAFPPRRRCLNCGSEDDWALTPLPRTGVVYTAVTVHVPVPGLKTPYSLAIVELDEVEVRALVKVTDVPAGTLHIGDQGELVLRRVAVRSGIPDYGYAVTPAGTTTEGGAA